MKFVVGIYRTVIHHRTRIIEAASSDEAYEEVSSDIENIFEIDDSGWRHNRTEHGIINVQSDLDGRLLTNPCNDGASVDAGGENGRPDVASESGQTPGAV